MLEVAGLRKTYPAPGGGLPLDVLAGIDLRVGRHEIVALVGTSGSGKSTLLRIVAGLEAPNAGRVTLDGRPLAGPTPEVAMVFQEPRLMPWLTAAANVRLAVLDLPRAEQERRIAAVLAQVGLTDFADALPSKLSGGMAQRVAIARALARDPAILLLDEPFSALDSFTRTRLQQHLLDLWREARFTILLVTHDLDQAVALADRIVVLRGPPGRAHRTFEVTPERPRRRSSPAFQGLREEIEAALDLG